MNKRDSLFLLNVADEQLARIRILEPIAELAARIDMLLAEEACDVGDLCEAEDAMHEALKPYRAAQCAAVPGAPTLAEAADLEAFGAGIEAVDALRVQIPCSCGPGDCNQRILAHNEYCTEDRARAGLAQETKAKRELIFSHVSWTCQRCGQLNSSGYMSCGRCELKVYGSETVAKPLAVTDEWCEMQADLEMLIHEVVAECEALRRGAAITYQFGHDPVSELKRRLPSVEQIQLTRPSAPKTEAKS